MDEATRLRLIEQIDRDLKRERGVAQRSRFPDWSTPPEAAPPRGGHFTRGISHGLRSLGATGAAAVGLAADQAGAERFGDAAMDRYFSMMEGIEAESLPEYNVGNWKTLGDAGRAAAYWLGNVGAQVVPSIATGGIAGLGARGLTQEAVRREAGRRAQSAAMQRQIQEQARTRASGTTAAATRIAENRTQDVIAQNLLARNQSIGFVAGSLVSIFPQTLGAAYGEAAQLADEQGLDRSSIDVGRVLAGGGGAGLAGVGQTLATAGLMRFGPARNVFDMLAGPAASRASRVATRGATGAAAAGGTEALQEQLIYYGAGGEGIAPANRLLTAAFAGGVFGGAVGGASGVPQPPPTAAPPLNPFRTATDEEIASRLQELPRVQDPAVAERVARDEARAAERAQQRAEREQIIRDAPPRPVPEVTLTRPKGISEEVWSTVPRLKGRLNNVIQTLFETPGLGKKTSREGPARDIDLNQRGRAALNAWKDAQVKAAEAAGLQKPAGVTDQAWRNLVSEIAGESNPFAVRGRAARVKGMTRGPKLETFMEQWNAPAATDPVQTTPVDPLATAPDTNQTTPPAATAPAATDPVQTPPAGLDSLRSLLSGDLPNMRAVRQVIADSIAGGNAVALRNIDVVRDDPAFNIVDTPEGVPVVVGVRVDPDGPWVGTAPTEAPAASAQTPLEGAPAQLRRDAPPAKDSSELTMRQAIAALLRDNESFILHDGAQLDAISSDPAYNVVKAPDGSTTVIGVQVNPGEPWVGQPPAPAATPASSTMPPQPDAPDVVRVAQQFDVDNTEYVASLEDSISKLLDVLYNQTDEALVADLEVVTPPDQKAPSPSAENPDAPTAQTENADKHNPSTPLSAMGVRTELTRGARGDHWNRADGKRMTPTDVRGLFYALGGITDNHLPESLSGRDSWLKAAQQIGHAEAWAPGVIDVTNRIHNTLKALDRVTKEVGDIMDGKKRGVMVDSTSFAQEQVRLNQRLAQEFAQLEQLVGRQNLLVMQRLTKSAIALRVMEQADVLELFAGVSVRGVSAIKRKGAQKAPKELPPQARYSRAFRDYRLGRTTSELLHPRIIRDMWERQKGNADYQANRMLLGKSLPEGLRKKVQGRPTDAVVQYLGFNAAQPWQRAVVRLIDRALRAQGLLEPGAIDWNFSKAKTGPKGELGTYQPYTDRPGGKITIYQNGHTNTVILHELIHAATVSALDTMANRPNVRAAVSDAERIAKALVRAYDKQGQSGFVATYGKNAQLALAAIKAVVESGDRTVIASELLSYGLTDSGVQQFMLDTKLPQPKATSMIGWMWSEFVNMVSKLLRFSIGDPTRAANIEPFLTTSARIFYQLSQDNALLKDATAAKRDALAAMGTIPPRPSGAFSATAMSQQTKHAKAAAAAAAKAEAGEAHTRSVEAALRRKTAADAEAALAQRQEGERKQIVAAEEITASTAIQKPDSATRDVLFFDRWGRGAFDAVLSAITSGKHSDFEARVESLRQASATKFQEFLRSDHTGPNGEMTPMEQFRRLVNYTATSLGLGVGLDRQTRSMQFRTMNADKTRGYNLGELMQTLHTINAEEASGVLRYIENPTVAELESITPDPETRSAIRMLGEGLVNAFAEAKRLRLIDARFDAENLTILDFVRLNDKETFRKTANAAIGKVTPNFTEPGRGPYRRVDPLTPHDIIGKDGNINRNVKRGDKFKLARIIDSGQVVAVDPAITHKLMQDKGLTYHDVELDNVFTVRQIRKKSASNEMASIVLGKLLTAEELQARKVDATTIASLVTAVHDWSRVAEFAKFRERLIAYNETQPIESRTILDAPPEGVPSNRVLDAPNRLSDRRPIFADALRLPGNWVRIPVDARGMWEPFRGKYLAAPLFSSIADMYNTTPHIQSPTMRLVMGVWKKHMTVWSPITWQHNIIGNLMFSYFHDIPARNIKLGTKLITHQVMPNIAKKYLPPLTKNEQAILDEIKAAGIELVSYKHQEIDRDSLDSLRNLTMQLGKTGDSSSVRDLTAVNTILQGIFSAYVKTDAAFSDFYSNQDNVFRAAAYITYLENAQARGEAVTETLLAQAGQYAREAFVDYQIDAPFINAIRFGRMGGIALPFIAWTYRATGIMAKTAITKPWKLLAVYGAVSAINAMAYGFLGADEEEERAILPEYMSRNVWGLPGAPRYMRLPFGDAENAVHMNLSSAIPLANVFEAADYGNLPGTLMPGGPTMIAIEAIFNYQFFRQQPITTEMDMFTAQHGKDFLTFAARSLGPRIVVDGFATGNDILVQRQGPTGSDPSRWIQLARTLGFNLRETDMFDARYYQSLDVQRIQRETAAAQNRVMRDYLRRGVEPDWDRAYEDVLRVAERGQQRILDRLGIED